MNTVKDILNTKGDNIWSVTPEIKVYDVLKLMADKNIGAVLVIKDDQVEGIFSERDYARKVVLAGHSSHQISVGEIMSTRVLYVTPNTMIDECMALMLEKRIRHLPVMENEKLVGLISIGDVVNELLNHKDFMINQLERYITDGR